MRKVLLIIVSASFYFLAVSCNNQQVEANSLPAEEEESLAQIKAQIRALEDTLAMAYNTKDVELFSKFYAPGAITYGEGREQLFGKKNIVNHFKENVVKDTNLTGTFTYQTIDVFAANNYAIETGRWEELDQQGAEVDHGFYMVVFEKQDGQYVSIRDIWNSSTQQEAFVTPEGIEADVLN